MEKVKVLFVGDAVVPTGFSRVLHSIAQNLPSDKYDIYWLGVNYYGDPHPYEYRIFPAFTKNFNDLYGVSRLEDIVKLVDPKIIFLLNDVWILSDYLKKLKDIKKAKPELKVVVYFPVDAEDHDPEWYQYFDVVDRPVVYTQFGYDTVKMAMPKLDLTIINHGVDTELFYKLPEAKEAIKRKVYGNKEDYVDSFIILNAGRNQPRKRLDITMLAFRDFAIDKPDNVKLYLHSGVRDSHIDTVKLALRLGIDQKLVITSATTGVQTVTNKKLNWIYNATDVGINTSYGEGWGLPNMEHAVTGSPQIVPDHSALRELYKDIGLLVPANDIHILNSVMTTGYLPRIEDVATAMQTLYSNRELLNRLSELSIKKFSSEEYSWKHISSQWDELFTSLL